MVSSWEIKAQRQVLVGILHTEIVPIAWAFGLRNLQIPGSVLPVTGTPFDHSRNILANATLCNGFEWLFCYDSDVIAPADTIHRLLAHRLPLVSGVYFRRSPPHGVPVAMKPLGQWLQYLPPSGLVEVDVTGAGCLLVHRSILEALPPQRPEAGKVWFDWRVDCRELYEQKKIPQHLPPLSEDFTFMVHVRQTLGVKTFLDASIRCRHVGLAQAVEGKMEPVEVIT